jgi:Glutaminase
MKTFLKGLSKPIIVFAMPALLLFTACNNNNKDKNAPVKPAVEQTKTDIAKPAQTENTLLTIAMMTEDRDGKKVELRFYEREAIYSIDKNNKAYTDNIGMLTEAIKTNIPVRFTLNATTGLLTNITKATDEEIRAYNTGTGINSPELKIKGATPVRIDVTKIDTAVFNRVDYQIRFPVFKLCTNVVPDYATLVNIFNYCASQGCNNPPPYTITNCIPFQYVRDGCYARAHKMRQMISKKYGYCVEKVFSFAEGYPNKLAVKANMWGGCCVEWWYHVVPLLRLNVKFGGRTFQICYVIDPGMFTTPVTLSTWLQAQKNTTCNPNANVTSYSIQPGSAYWPMGSSASFGTDPNYVNTEQTLIGYKNSITCN